MNTVEIEALFTDYGLPSVIIAMLCAVLFGLLDKFFSKKIPFEIRSYIPSVTGVILYLAYDFIFVGEQVALTEKNVTAGIMAGALGYVIFAFIKNLKSGKPLKSANYTVVREILSEFLQNEALDRLTDEICRLSLSLDNTAFKAELKEILSTVPNVEKENLDALINLIDLSVNAANGIKRKK